MKVLYLDCGMGAAGDMLAAALLELIPDPETFLEELNSLGLSGILFRKEDSVKCGNSFPRSGNYGCCGRYYSSTFIDGQASAGKSHSFSGICGEMTMESTLRLGNVKKACLDCFHPYNRFG